MKIGVPFQKKILLFFFSHPDCYCRLWNYTKSCEVHYASLAGYTAGGELHPAPKNYFVMYMLIPFCRIVNLRKWLRTKEALPAASL